MSFDYNEYLQKIEIQRQEDEASAKNQLFLIVKKLKSENVENVEITFDGMGDDGQIDEILIHPLLSDNSVRESLMNEIENWTYLFLEGTGIDWVNNDGGFGTIFIDVENNKFTYTVNQREMTSTIVASGEEEI